MSYFIRGVIFVVPIGFTIWVLYGTVHSVDLWARTQLGLQFPGLGLLVTLAATTFLGFLASNFLTRQAMNWFERMFDSLPLVKLLHGSLKDVLSAFVGDKKRFDKPVIVDINGNGRVVRFKIAQPSGYRALDDSIRAAGKRVGQVDPPPLPDGTKQVRLRINFDLDVKR